jgi:hypothetical protein
MQGRFAASWRATSAGSRRVRQGTPTLAAAERLSARAKPLLDAATTVAVPKRVAFH